MFPVGRYDPREQEREAQKGKKSRKKQRDNQDKNEQEASKPSLQVIAHEETETAHLFSKRAKVAPATAEEAFDDLGVTIEEIIEGNVAHVSTEAAATETDASQLSWEEVQTALHMANIPITEAAEGWKIAPFLVENLKRDGFKSFFPIQALAIPDVIASERHAHIRAQDICIAAPTGSGKTLAYVLPILNSLSQRKVRRLRALCVLPSRDLATQVYQVFQSYVEGSPSRLRVGLSIGQTSFNAEQIALTVDPDDDSEDAARLRLSFEPDNLELALTAFRDPSTLSDEFSPSKQSKSSVDILICTPGRLVDHLSNTAGFNLQHLRFLVVDEADRLLSQRYHNWIDRVIQSANSASTAAYCDIVANENKMPDLEMAPDGCSFRMEPIITWRRGGTEGDDSDFNTNDSFFAVASSVCRPVQLRKILVSATLTRDPRKLASLHLVNPKHFDAHQLTRDKTESSSKQYSMPAGLEEFTVECTAEQKPLVLLALLLERLQQKPQENDNKSIIVIFTASLDSTHRLVRLLQLLWIAAGYGAATTVSEFSSSLSQKDRSALMNRCKDLNDNLAIVVCSDGMSRGMDIQYASTVINYDVPSLAKNYVHRCGRTARAGSKGTAISLLKGGQVGQFARMRRLIQSPDSVQAIGVEKSLVRDVLPMYRKCIQALRDVLDAEENGELNHIDVNLEDFLSDD